MQILLKKSRLYGSPPKVIWLRCGNTKTSTVELILRLGREAIQELFSNSSLDCLELY
jgi:predicted nuclease of predicted toxin-antitoxin system